MATPPKSEIILYDLACTKNVCFSPVVWRIRLLLNYKRISYKTIFLEFPDIEPTLKELGLVPIVFASGAPNKYTVPAIYHVPSNTYMMDSAPISEFLSLTYPDPPLPLTSYLGRDIEAKTRAAVGRAFAMSIMPREINILSPRSQEFFRRTREASLGQTLEDLLDPVKEDQAWSAADDNIRAAGELMRTHEDDGPFVLGSQASYTDFFIAGSLQSARMVDEGVFRRMIKYPGFGEIYKACLPLLGKND